MYNVKVKNGRVVLHDPLLQRAATFHRIDDIVGSVEKQDSKWVGRSEDQTMQAKTRREAAWKLADLYFHAQAKLLRERLPSRTVIRRFTEARLTRIFDVLVDLWGVQEDHRADFMAHWGSENPPMEYRIGYGKVWKDLGLSMEYPVNGRDQLRMVLCALKLQEAVRPQVTD